MRMLFKAVGLIVILCTCTAAGFLKAVSLKNRLEGLKTIKNGLSKLKERLRLHGGDKQRLINACFSSPPETLSDLKKSDKALWCEFLSDFGKGDTQQECDRCKAYIALFEGLITTAAGEYNEQQKLYKSLGFLSGVFICIFFL